MFKRNRVLIVYYKPPWEFKIWKAPDSYTRLYRAYPSLSKDLDGVLYKKTV